MKPTVSVLMSVYNTEKYVGAAIDSVLAQTLTNFELLITDDGSTDGSLAVLQRYAAKDQRIRLFSRENRGISRTRNEMLNVAQGEFVAIMDSDDLTYPDRLVHQVEFLQENPHIVGVGGEYVLMDEHGRFLMTNPVPLNNAAIQEQLLAGYVNNFLDSTTLVRREALVAIGGYTEALVALDLDTFLRLGEYGELANLPEPMLKYRLRTTSTSSLKSEAYKRDARIACEQAWQRRGVEGEYAPDKDGRIRHDDSDCTSRHDFMLKYGWWAFGSGYRWTAMIYAWKAIQALPLKVAGWKLLVCCLVKPVSVPKYS